MPLRFLILLTCLIFVSCDIVKTLRVTNKSDQRLELVLSKTDREILLLEPLTNIELEPYGEYFKHYGFGKWTKDEKNKLRQSLQQNRIVFRNDTGSNKNIYIARHGLFGNGMSIKIK